VCPNNAVARNEIAQQILPVGRVDQRLVSAGLICSVAGEEQQRNAQNCENEKPGLSQHVLEKSFRIFCFFGTL